MRRGRHHQHGLSLIELMIAMALGLLVSAGVIALFSTTSNSDLARAQLDRLQEEGRFAMTQIKHDLAMAGAQYCVGSGGNAHVSTAGTYLDALRAPTVYANDEAALMSALSDVTTPWSDPYPSTPTDPYSLPSFLAMRGYDCTVSDCKPADPSKKKNPNGFSVPAMGSKVGDRVIGASVLTVRYLDPSGGWALPADGSGLTSNVDGSLSIHLNASTSKRKPSDFKPSHPLALLADCSHAQIFAVSGQGTTQLMSTSDNFVQPAAYQNMVAPKVFDLNLDEQTITYFLAVVDNGDGLGHTTGALIRRVNGGGTRTNKGSSEEIARGVERLDFKYGVQRADGTVRYYSAEQVDSSNAVDCPPLPLPIRGGNDHGCLWRSVSLIEVDMLVDGQQPLHALAPDELAYTYAADSLFKPDSPTASGRLVTPLQQGFPLPMLRREFTAVIALRNFNP
jgi:type IV pilus assembly protein PilW